MTSLKERKELVKELHQKKAEVSTLRSSLNGLDEEKESLYRKKNELSSDIKATIQRIKDNRYKRDNLTKEVKELKVKRDALNKELTSKFGEFNRSKKDSSSKKFNDSPFKIKQNMDRLELSIETDALPFKKEQEVMKKIKDLKKEHEKAKEAYEKNKLLRECSKVAKKLRAEANEVHKYIQEKAKESQELHEQILKDSKLIDKAKADEKQAYSKFSEFRKKFNNSNSKLKERLISLNTVKVSLNKIKTENIAKKKQEEEEFLKSKEDEVHEKIKKGKKLTTEDLLVFQKSNL
jgi:uncharacterized coiled-coil DUF342 family protein